MKTTSTTIISMIGLGMLLSTYSSASDVTPPGSTPTNTPIIIVIKNPRFPSKHPKAPSAQCISCSYLNGYISISFAIPEGESILTVTDSHGFSSNYEFDTAVPTEIFIGEYTEAIIEISTANGHSYEGHLVAE